MTSQNNEPSWPELGHGPNIGPPQFAEPQVDAWPYWQEMVQGSIFFLLLSAFCSLRLLLASSQFSKEFGLQFPGGPTSLLDQVKKRKVWSALELYDRTKEAKLLPADKKHEVFDALGPVIQCPTNLLNSYGKGDGEKRICGLMADPCVVISLGSQNVWDFEQAIIAKHPQCKVHTFDCYTPGHVPPNLRKAVTSYTTCIGPVDQIIGGKQFLSWPSILKLIGINTPPTALKMDIEGYEWAVIREMLTSSPHHLLPLSISFELHTSTHITDIGWQKRTRSAPEVALFMEYLLKFGYLLVDRHDNPFCLHCTEIVVARVLPSKDTHE
jgi:hypothetical protein